MEKIEEIAARYASIWFNKSKKPYDFAKVKTQFLRGMIQVLTNPSEFNLVSQEEYDKLKRQADDLAEAVRSGMGVIDELNFPLTYDSLQQTLIDYEK